MAEEARAAFHIVRAHRVGHVADALVEALEDQLAAAAKWPVDPSYNEAAQASARALAAASLPFPWRKSRDAFMVMMGPYRIPMNAADWMSSAGKKAAWVFDAWPNSYQALHEFVHTYDLDALFITAKQSADRMARAISGCDVKWCPEPLIDLGFQQKLWPARGIDVIQFGRKYEPYHEALLAGFVRTSVRYVYEEEKGKIVFPTTKDFVLGLANSKISICFPCDLTDTERAGDVSTVTQRYLQSFASGCLVVGKSPPELVQLFGYDPVVLADMNNPGGQIEEILAFPDRYQALVEQNLAEVRQHTVKSRLPIMTRELD